jgi:hypothetical protein
LCGSRFALPQWFILCFEKVNITDFSLLQHCTAT